jgi:hypothetical protein
MGLFFNKGLKTFNEKKDIDVGIHNIPLCVMYILCNINRITFNNKYYIEFPMYRMFMLHMCVTTHFTQSSVMVSGTQ